MSRIKILIMMLLMSLSLSTSAQNSDNDETTTTTCTVSVELQELILADEDLKHALDEVNPEDALHFSEESLEEISHAEAFCFDSSTRTMMLWGSNFEEGVMIWGPGLRYSFLSEIKTCKISIERTSYVPEIKSTTVWTPRGKLKPSCKGKKLYRVVRTR